jgi:hypothetical protein
MSQEILVTKSKKKQTKSPFGQPRIEESQERYSTQDERDSGVIARDISIAVREQVKKASEEFKVQERLFQLENRKLDEKSYTVHHSLTNSELGNVAKVVLSDPTITLGKGRQQLRKHRKILGPLYHTDQEETTEITFSRSGAEGQ